MTLTIARPGRRVSSSVSRSDLLPEISLSTGSVAVMALLHWLMIPYVGARPPLVLFTATAAAITFWRGLGPGVAASIVGSSISSSLFIAPSRGIGLHGDNVPVETLLLFGATLFTCWLIFRLKADNEAIEVGEERRTDAIAFVAHELRNPLSNIRLAASMLEREPSEPSEATKKATRLIVSSAVRLGTVVDELSDVIRLQAGAIRISSAELDLREVVRSAVDAATPSIQARRQDLRVDLGDLGVLPLDGDAYRLQQVFGNLLSNASRYSPEGAVIAVCILECDGQAQVVVSDSGVGIARDMLDRIFDPFVRGRGQGADGLGIGLALVRIIVAQHGGTVAAHSDGPGRGSSFTVALPLRRRS